MGKNIRFIFSFIRAFSSALATDESGQGMVEYMLLLSAIVVGTGALIRGLLKAVGDGVLTMGGAIEKDLKTGRAALNVWSN